MSEEIRKKLLNSFPKEAKLPRSIKFNETNDGIEMILSKAAIGKADKGQKHLNMQENGAAFEGWAVVIYNHYLKNKNEKNNENKKVILKFGEKLEYDLEFNYGEGHYNRFLYRAMRFSEQYKKWFVLDSNLRVAIDRFKMFFESESEFINNSPSQKSINDADKTGDVETESDVEKFFISNEIEKKKLLKKAGVKSELLFRQLPVGLFKKEIKLRNSFFTGGKSAIDLWSIDDNGIALFELKTHNKMIGIITELFFYSNYINDIFVKKNNITCYSTKELDIDKNRGYPQLLNKGADCNEIKSFFLVDEIHPLINTDVINLLNDNKIGNIKYDMIKYRFVVNAEVL